MENPELRRWHYMCGERKTGLDEFGISMILEMQK
jgi:hypothetical protein